MMKKLTLLFSAIFAISNTSSACPFCNREIANGIYNSQFYPNLITVLSAFIVLAVIVVILSAITSNRHRARLSANPEKTILSPVPLTTAAMVIGIGLGGFIDGVVLHQILQWHEMLSAKIPNTEYIGKSINMFWDGIFHFFCLLVTLTGIVLLWKLLKRDDINRSGKLLSGGLLLGWGLFNIVEGVIDHHLLKLHNVMELVTDHAPANFAFLGGSVAMILIGCAMVNRVNKH
jgi:uncharacterized membrane protein